MKLCHRMVKSFGEMLSTSGKLDFPQLAEVSSSGIGVTVRESTEVGRPSGMTVVTSTSLWLPLAPLAVFEFITNEESRIQVCFEMRNLFPVSYVNVLELLRFAKMCI